MLNRLFNFPWIYLFNRNPEGPPSLDVLFLNGSVVMAKKAVHRLIFHLLSLRW